MKKIILSLLAICLGFSAISNVRLPKFFAYNMVLQREHPVPVWGWADPKEKICVQIDQQSKTTTADKNGKWKIALDPEVAGGPYQLIVKGNNTITIGDVLFGDVWVCSGQSNMEWTVKQCSHVDQDIQSANYPQIRHFLVPRAVASMPMEDVSGGKWEVCTPKTVGDFTAVGFFFARSIYEEIHVPIGLIHTSWGGTQSESWTSRDAFENTPEFKSLIAQMPKLNLDSLAKVKMTLTAHRITQLQGSFTQDQTVISKWKSPEYRDEKWPKMQVPGQWESQELGDFDGLVWLRKTFSVAEADAGKEAELELAMIDDSDDTYLNGVAVGGLHASWNTPRKYSIPKGLLKAGNNVIAVKVEDTGGGGGIYGEAANVKITIGGKVQSLAGEWKYQVEESSPNVNTVGPNSYPTLLYNSMIHPLIPFAIKGAIWYQGEANAGRSYQYRIAFPMMIKDWRNQWGQGDFPFYFVQLASFNANNGNSQRGSGWAELREAQLLTLSLPNTGMAVTTDIGESNDIHPKNKQDVGKRLAAIALHRDYGKNKEYSGPVYQSMELKGSRIVISFSHIGSGLTVRDPNGILRGFEIAGKDQVFQAAKAYIEGDKVVVFQDGVPDPVAVRFGWADDAGADNLFNKDGFPASPFRTDDWKGITAGAVFKF